ncbi:MAG: response regulator [Candidatus Omnitrophica bacterium]|nr:response regulator [Candidatus Omnitrophota bacterium]
MADSILIVDNEANITITLEWFFQTKGYKVLRAFYGEQALEQIEKGHPSVVILDLQMPGVNGIAVLEQIRNQYPGVKVVVVTGYVERYQKELERLHPEAIKVKPVPLGELVQTVETLFGKEDPAAVPARPVKEAARIRLLFIQGMEELYQQHLKPYFEEPQRQDRFETALAQNPEEAFSLLKEFKPHLVLLDDSRMPVGVKVGEFAAALSSAPACPLDVILYTFSKEQLPQLEQIIRRAAESHHLFPASS